VRAGDVTTLAMGRIKMYQTLYWAWLTLVHWKSVELVEHKKPDKSGFL